MPTCIKGKIFYYITGNPSETWPWANAPIKIYKSQTSEIVEEGSSDESGNYCIDNVPAMINVDIIADEYIGSNYHYYGKKTGVYTGLMKIEAGSTTPGATNWKPYVGTFGIYLDVDTSAAGFTSTPIYITSLGGASYHWMTTGATSIYNATPTGFRVYLRPTYSDGRKINPNFANEKLWHIQWIGMEQRSCSAGNCIEIEDILAERMGA